MSDFAESIYSSLVDPEKLKSGTPYERLAAIVFRRLIETTTVHDLKLCGESTVEHQIDVLVGDGDVRQRILIECKDYKDKVDLKEVRSFFAVVDDIKPDAAFIVTTTGFTEPAATFATAKGITAAVLRPPRDDDDWAGLIRRIEIKILATVPTSDPRMLWQADSSTSGELIRATPQGLARTDTLTLIDQNGERRPAKPEIEAAIVPPLGFQGTFEVTHTFDEPTWLQAGDTTPIKMIRFQSQQDWGQMEQEVVVGDGIAGLAAELVLKSLDGSIHQMFSNRDIQQWTFDSDGEVVPRAVLAAESQDR